MELHFLKTCSVWAIPKLHVSKSGWEWEVAVYTCVYTHMYVQIYVWEYPSKSYSPFPRVKIAKIKDMATWLESGTKATAQCPCPSFLIIPQSDTQTQILQSRQTQC